MSEPSSYPFLDLLGWFAPIIGVVLFVALTLSGGWSAASFSVGFVSGVWGIAVGLFMGFVAGAVLAFPYFILGELSRALVDLLANTRASTQHAKEMLEVLRDR